MTVSIEAGKTYIRTLRAISNERDPLAFKLSADRMLSAADLYPRGLSDNAIVCIRSFHALLPSAQQGRYGGGRLPARWEEHVRASLKQVIQQADHPLHGNASSSSEAVIFADRAEMLAALAIDWRSGTYTQRWWWQSLFRGANIGSMLLPAWLETPEYIPAALSHLADKREIVPFVRRLSAQEARSLLQSITRTFALRELQSVLSTGQLSLPSSHAPWEQWVPESADGSLTLEHQALTGIGLMLLRVPSIVRSTSFAQAVYKWHTHIFTAGGAAAPPPRVPARGTPTMDEDAATSSVVPALAAGGVAAVPPDGMAAVPPTRVPLVGILGVDEPQAAGQRFAAYEVVQPLESSQSALSVERTQSGKRESMRFQAIELAGEEAFAIQREWVEGGEEKQNAQSVRRNVSFVAGTAVDGDVGALTTATSGTTIAFPHPKANESSDGIDEGKSVFVGATGGRGQAVAPTESDGSMGGRGQAVAPTEVPHRDVESSKDAEPRNKSIDNHIVTITPVSVDESTNVIEDTIGTIVPAPVSENDDTIGTGILASVLENEDSKSPNDVIGTGILASISENEDSKSPNDVIGTGILASVSENEDSKSSNDVIGTGISMQEERHEQSLPVPETTKGIPLPHVYDRHIETRYGGLFYLVNLGIFLNLYGDFTTPLQPGLDLSIWDFMALLGEQMVGESIYMDPIWSLLAQLAGRTGDVLSAIDTTDAINNNQEPPGLYFEPPEQWRVPVQWLRAFPEAEGWQWSKEDGRLRVKHPAQFLVLDLPLMKDVEPVEQLKDELRLYADFFEGTMPKLAYVPLRLLPDESLLSCGQPVIRIPARPLSPALQSWLCWLMPYIYARLQRALGMEEDENPCATLCRHSASISVSATHLRIDLVLAELPIAIRIAGLDRDPGWVPAAGRFIAFHFS